MTRFGPLGLLSGIGRSSGYGDLVQSTVVIEAGSQGIHLVAGGVAGMPGGGRLDGLAGTETAKRSP